MYQKCWRQMLSWVNISKLLVPFFWSVPVRQRTKMRRKRKSFPILFFFWLSSTQMSLLSDSVFSFRLQRRSVCSLLAVGVTQVTRKPPTQKKKKPPWHLLGLSRNAPAFCFCFNMLSERERLHTWSLSRCCTILWRFYGIQRWQTFYPCLCVVASSSWAFSFCSLSVKETYESTCFHVTNICLTDVETVGSTCVLAALWCWQGCGVR